LFGGELVLIVVEILDDPLVPSVTAWAGLL
jgi:hypothetical protein